MTTSPTVAGPQAPAPLRPSPARERELRQELKRRLDKLARVFDIADVRRSPLATEQVVQYFEDCQDAFRKYHSSAGAVHMALNDGNRFDPDGYFGQVRRLEATWQPAPPVVLELAYGQGFNLEYLARRHNGSQFLGIDITPAHQRIASERMARAGLHNVRLELGDFLRLPYADASVDAVFCIEAFCYAKQLHPAIAEVRRVLRPGGRFTLVDGYNLRSLQHMHAQGDSDGALACELVARGMALDSLQVLDELLGTARELGFQVHEPVVLDQEVLPTLRRLERVTGAVIRWPWLGRRALARRSALRGRNILSGYLMRNVTELGLLGYREITLALPA